MNADSSDKRVAEGTFVELRWVTLTLKLLPVPIFAFAVLATTTIVSIISAIFANMEHSTIGWMISGVFAAISALIASASITRYFFRRRINTKTLQRYADSRKKPTFAILVLLILIYTWMLTIALHVFEIFFAVNRLGGVKYF